MSDSSTLPLDLARMQAERVASLSAADAAADIAELRRHYVACALEGMQFQASAAIRFLQHGDDGCAENAMVRLFDLARKAAAEMKALRSDPSSNLGATEAQ